MRDFAHYEPELPLQPELPLAQDTLAQKFAAYDRANPEVWIAFKDCVFEHINKGETYISAGELAPEIRKRIRHGVNKSYIRFYGDRFKREYYAGLIGQQAIPGRVGGKQLIDDVGRLLSGGA